MLPREQAALSVLRLGPFASIVLRRPPEVSRRCGCRGRFQRPCRKPDKPKARQN